jgi:hypothetical protein
MVRVRSILVAAGALAWTAVPAVANHPADFVKALTPWFRNDDFGPAEKLFLPEARSAGRNQLLYLYEMANLYQMRGDVDKSIDLFAEADRVAHGYEGKAIVSASGAASQTGATLTNDTLLPWEGGTADKVMARTLDAINYLVKADLEDATVEVRKAEEYQVREREKRQKTVSKAAAMSATATAKYGEMFSYVQDVRNSYENAFTYYLSSQIYRAQGPSGLDDALVDIKRAYELSPRSPAVRTAYLDLTAQAGGPAALADLKRRLGVPPGPQLPDPARTGTVVVVFETGFVPPLSEVSIDVLAEDKLISMAFPIYRQFGPPQPSLRISGPGLEQSTTLAVDLRRLEVKALQERMPEILLRGTAGAIAKVQAQKKATQSFGLFGQLASIVATKVVTVADLRSWLSLPAEVQTAQFTLPAGPADLTLASYEWTEHLGLQVTAGGTTFLLVRAAPGFHSLKTVALQAVDHG